MITGVVLAAGRSSRMGSPKALLTLDGKTFLQRIVDALREGGCDEVIVVVGSQEQANPGVEVQREAVALRALTAVNPDPDSGQIDSLRAALRSLPAGTTSILSTPVDAPGVTPEIVRLLIEAGGAPGADIVIPTFAGRRGHPVLFGAAVLDELRNGDLPEGARSVIHRDEKRVFELPVGTAAVLMDVDTPDDYARLVEQR